MANDRRGGEAEKRRAGRREKGEGWIPRSEEMKTKGGMDGMEITKRDEHLAHPSLDSCDPSPAGRQNGKTSGQAFMSAAFLPGSVPD